jgi:hypothetical protein
MAIIVSGIFLAAPVAAQARHITALPAPHSKLLVGVMLGYNSGQGIDATISPQNLFGRSPLHARFGLRYASVNAGDAALARHVFINDNTNGTPQESGHTIGLKLDLLYPVHLFSAARTHAFAGFRYARFTGDYRYVGGNEDFEITSNHWGFGGGLETAYPISRRVAMTLTAGLDYFLPSRLYGHDTAYSPDGTTENPKAGYTYADADRAVGQPKLSPIMMVGMQFGL